MNHTRPSATVRCAAVLGAGLLAATLLGAGCGGGPFGDFVVTDASLHDVDWQSAAIIGGASWTSGLLDLTDDSGQVHAFDVDVSGPEVGFFIDIGTGDNNPDDCLLQSSASLVLPAGKQVIADDVAGVYAGTKGSLRFALGAEEHDLQNGAGVKLSGGAFDLGMGIWLGFEWLGIGVK